MTQTPFSFFVFVVIIFLTFALSPKHVTSLGSGSTIAISYGTQPTICGIVGGETISCYHQGHTISILPNISFQSISGGLNFFCGIRTDGYSLHCWDTTAFMSKRIYHSQNVRLTALSIGDTHVCALEVHTGLARCWRGGTLIKSPDSAFKLRTITSGRGFSCAILRNGGRVVCWGGNKFGVEIEGLFRNLSMSTLFAGESHACGLTRSTRILICKGGNNIYGQLNVPSHSPNTYSDLAVGVNFSCAVLRTNGLVTCWGGLLINGFEQNVSFKSIVSSLDFTCGLTTNLSVFCWGKGWSSSLAKVPLLKNVIPGPCVETSCNICGVYPGSKSLCDGDGSICMSCDFELPLALPLPSILQTNSSTSSPRNTIYLIVGSVGIFSGLCTIIYCVWAGFCVFWYTKNQEFVRPNDGSSVLTSRSSFINAHDSLGSSMRGNDFSLSELAIATNNFSEENKIGSGSFGTVYKGKLADNRQVAIKRGETSSKNKESAFNSELALLSRLHHKHLVELVGFCHEKEERLLVYEYMTNGSLYNHLHYTNNVENNNNILNSWRMRIKIALDAARGIDYLHNYAVPPIIHRDIKSSNILLDLNMTVRVSDFGLSLIMGPGPDQDFLSTKAVGTIGYIDPEYYVLNILTTKSDVYSFGVVLLELLTGKRAVFKNEDMCPMGVVEYALPRISRQEMWKVLDTRVGFPDVQHEAEAVQTVAYTAMKCVNLEGKDRPTMSEIVLNLETALALYDDGSYGSYRYK